MVSVNQSSQVAGYKSKTTSCKRLELSVELRGPAKSDDNDYSDHKYYGKYFIFSLQ